MPPIMITEFKNHNDSHAGPLEIFHCLPVFLGVKSIRMEVCWNKIRNVV